MGRHKTHGSTAGLTLHVASPFLFPLREWLLNQHVFKLTMKVTGRLKIISSSSCEQEESIAPPKVMKRYCGCFLKLAYGRYVCFLPSPSSTPKSGDNLNRKEEVTLIAS